MKVIKPPNQLYLVDGKTVFLAGSIEQGKATDWQATITKSLSKLDITVLNPRRDDWDPTWDQSDDNPEFVAQVNWEMDGMNGADWIAMYFDPKTKSPITLLELGLHAARKYDRCDPSKKMIVCCPKGYWRKGNVNIVCKRYNIPMVNSLRALTAGIKEKYNERNK